MDQLFISVRAWRGCCHKPIFDAFEQVQKRLICLTAEAAKHAGFIQADGGEQVRGLACRRGYSRSLLYRSLDRVPSLPACE